MWGIVRLLLFATLAAFLLPDTLRAQDNPTPCHGAGDAALGVQEDLAGVEWICEGDTPSYAPDRVWLRFTVAEGELPEAFVTHRSIFKELHLVTQTAEGERAVRALQYDEMRPAEGSSDLSAAIPPVSGQIAQVFIAFDQPTDGMQFSQARLRLEGKDSAVARQREMMLLAMLCGMMLMPLVFNASAYRVLHQPFVLWHAALAISLLATVLADSGIWAYFLGLSITQITQVHSLATGASLAAAGMFLRSFVEPGRIHPILHRALAYAAVWSVALCIWTALFPFAVRSFHNELFHLGFVPVLAVYFAALANALLRRSRAAWFQLVGWIPFFLVGGARIAGTVIPALPDTDAQMMFYIGCFIEITATALGVADRFMIIKRQRDRARAESAVLEEVSERDALTGLLNRRGMENRFEAMRADGYTTLAIVDLDHFKTVNDRFGHAAGDEVLKIVADTLRNEDQASRVFRMGGEEFIVLLKGRHAAGEAERRRMAIPKAIREAGIIDGRVTASMGLVDAPLDAMPDATFRMLYEKADRLLYEAKAAGRDRTITERLKAFRPRRKVDRRVAA